MPFPQSISADGLAFIRKREALRLVAYKDGAGVWTIGYGHTGPEVHAGMRITEVEADRLLEQVDAPTHADGVKLALRREPSQLQFDAMCSLAFNIGAGAFATSTVCRAFNAGDDMAAANAFGLFIKIRDPVTKKRVDSNGLIARRAMEKAMFLRGTVTEAPPIGVAVEAKPLTQSGTIQGGTVATVAGAISGAAALVNEVQDTAMNAPWIGPLAQTAVAHYPKIAGLLALVMVAAGGYVLWRRYHDRQKGRV